MLAARRAAGADVPLAELARHFSQADPHSADTFRYCAAAAREAAGQLAYEEAVRHWEAALTAVSAAPPGPGLTATLLDLAEARGRAGDLTAAGDAFRRAAALARRQQDASALARAALGLQAIGTRAWWPPDEVSRPPHRGPGRPPRRPRPSRQRRRLAGGRRGSRSRRRRPRRRWCPGRSWTG